MAGALASYEEGLAIRRKLLALDEGNTLWRRDVAVGLGEIGDVKTMQSDQAGALSALEESLAAFRRLADGDKATPNGSTTSRWRWTRSAI